MAESRGKSPAFERQMSLSDLEKFFAKVLQEKSNHDTTSDRSSANHVQLNNSEIPPLEAAALPAVYGRICTTKDAQTFPVKLSEQPGRKTAFIFGPETVHGALMDNIHDPYTMLLRLGFLPEYIYLKACKQRACYWLILLSPDNHAHHHSNSSSPTPSTVTQHPSTAVIQPVPATWDGLLSYLSACYPESLSAVRAHWPLITSKPVSFFEAHSPRGVKFIQALADPSGPDFMSYEKFCALPPPRSARQTRLFLYCELRIFELFSGDGHTWSEAGVKGEKEYLAPNYTFENLGKENYIVIPLKVKVPQEVQEKFRKS